jgi:predicted house-cleaning noncanonical NTP pyrophosphatase (MazG superfamily)
VSSSEYFYRNALGQKCDAELHEELLNNPAAELAISLEAVKRAMEQDGMTREMAEQLYGLDQPLKLPKAES